LETFFGPLGPLPDMSALRAVSWIGIAALTAGALLTFAAEAGPRLMFLWGFRERTRDGGCAEPEPLKLRRLLPLTACGALVVGGPIVLGELALEGWGDVAVAGFLLWLTVVGPWRWWINRGRFRQPPPTITIPREAVLGALTAVGVVVALLAIIIGMRS
jgi:hypothetical protein